MAVPVFYFSSVSKIIADVRIQTGGSLVSEAGSGISDLGRCVQPDLVDIGEVYPQL